MANGNASCTLANFYGSRCTFQCRAGYSPSNSSNSSNSTQAITSESECLSDGQWSEPAPLCTRQKCLSLLDQFPQVNQFLVCCLFQLLLYCAVLNLVYAAYFTRSKSSFWEYKFAHRATQHQPKMTATESAVLTQRYYSPGPASEIMALLPLYPQLLSQPPCCYQHSLNSGIFECLTFHCSL